LPATALVVGSIGRLVHERRPDLLLEAFAELSKVHASDVHLLLGGEGPERARLAERARHLGLAERVHLPGIILDPPTVLGLIDLYLTVNVGPMTGIAAMEAAFSGIPVMAAQLLPAHAVAASDWIWSSPDPSALGRKAGELLADGEARALLSRDQQAYVRARHGVEAMAKAYYRLYEEALVRRETDRGS
jgi:glycosyltransferase involved in cell wall biosynthesis